MNPNSDEENKPNTDDYQSDNSQADNTVAQPGPESEKLNDTYSASDDSAQTPSMQDSQLPEKSTEPTDTLYESTTEDTPQMNTKHPDIDSLSAETPSENPEVSEQQSEAPNSFSAVPQQPVEPTPVNEQRFPGEIPAPASEASRPYEPVAPVVMGGDTSSSFNTPMPGVPKKKSRKKLFVGLAVAIVALIVLGGGIALAYLQVIVPNKPENVLKTSLYNTMQSTETTTTGEVEISSDGDSFPATTVEFLSESDFEQKAMSSTVKITMTGIDFSFDARMVEEDLYVRVGDLSTIKSLIAPYLGLLAEGDEQSASISRLIDQADELVSNQWILFDKTVLKEAGVSCLVAAEMTLTDDDIKLLEEQYVNNPFATIDSYTDESVDGVDSIKYTITIDNKKTSDYMNGLRDLSFVKKLEGCDVLNEELGDQLDTELNPDELAVDGTTELTLWVDKEAKRINKFALPTTELDADSGVKASVMATVVYGSVEVEKPENAKPVIQFVSELQALFLSEFDFDSGL